MVVKLKKRQGKARLTVKAKHTGRRKDEPEVENQRDVALDVSANEPCSVVGVSLGYRVSQNFQSVHMDVHVSVPVKPGEEEKGLEYARSTADRFLADSGDDVSAALRQLSE